MALSKSELDQLAESFAKQLKKHGIGGESEGNSFSQNNARKSRGSDRDPSTMLSDMDEMLVGTFEKTIKRWKDAHRDAARMISGSALRDAHDLYADTLEEVAKKTKSAGKQVVESYYKLIEANKNNHAVQQKAHDTLTDYTDALEKLKVMTDKKAQSRDDRDAIKKVRDTVWDLEEKLKELGVEVEEAAVVYNKTTKNFEIKNKESVEEIIRVNNKLIDANEQYVDDLTGLHQKELKAKDDFVKGLIAITTKGLGEAIDKTLTTAASRLQNVQASTDFIAAALNGMSPREMNEWYNANRNALALQGLSAEEQSDALQDTMNKFGYFGAAMMQTIGKMNDIQMRSGIEFSKANSEALMETVARVQTLEGVSREEAIRMVASASESSYHMIHAYGKSSEEQVKLLQQQVFTSRQIARSTGLSAHYMEAQEQQQVNARFASIVDKVTTSAMMPAYITEMEKLLGRSISEDERMLMREERFGFTSEENRQAYNAGIGKDLREGYARRADLSSQEARAGRGFSQSIPLVAGEVIGQRMGYDTRAEALEGIAAANRIDTQGEAELRKNYDELIESSTSSLGAIEQFYNTAKGVLSGAQQSPAGGFMSAAGGVAQDYATMKVIDFAIGKIGRRFGFGRAATAAAGSGGSAAGPGIMSRMLTSTRGGIGNMWGSAKGGIGNMWGAARGLGARGLTGMAGMGAGLKTFGTDALSALRGMSPSSVMGGLAKAHGLGSAISGSLIGAYQGYNTSTSDYANELGIATPNSVAGDLSLRSAGVMSDVGDSILSGLTLGAVDGQTIADSMSVGVSDFIGGTINDVLKVFGGGVDDTAYQQQKALEAQEAMTSGSVLGEDGEEIKSVWDRMLSVLGGIEENTEETIETIESTSAAAQEMEERRQNQANYAQRVRSNVEDLLNNRAESLSASTLSVESRISGATAGLP